MYWALSLSSSMQLHGVPHPLHHSIDSMTAQIIMNLMRFATYILQSEPPHGLYLLDNGRISQVSPTTGKTRRKLPSLASVQSTISLLAHSPNGAYLGGLTAKGDMFLWEKETDIVESFVTPLSRMGSESVKTDPLTFQGRG